MTEKGEVFNDRYSQYYNLFYSDKDYKAEVDYVHSLLRANCPGAKAILEYGSGTGGHGVLLQELGYDVFGIEKSEEMAKLAIARSLPCLVGDIRDFQLNRKFDACVSLFHVISYVNSNEDVLRVFRNTKNHLSSGGIFIFDVWFTPAVLFQQPEVRVKRIANEKIAVTRIATPEMDHIRNCVNVNYHIFTKDKASGGYSEFDEIHSMRHFGVPEIELLAMESGFSVLRSEEFLTSKAPSVSTWGVTFILRSK